MNSRHDKTAFSCIVLAGGSGTRMHGSDKGVMQVCGKSLTEILLQSLRGHVDDIVISANRTHDFYRQFGSRVVADGDRYHGQGPLAGLASCLPACHHNAVLVCCCDMPLIPAHIIEALQAGLHGHDAAVVSIDDRRQLLFSVTADCADDVNAALAQDQPGVMSWLQARDCKIIDCDVEPPWLLNVNTPAQLRQLEQHLATS